MHGKLGLTPRLAIVRPSSMIQVAGVISTPRSVYAPVIIEGEHII